MYISIVLQTNFVCRENVKKEKQRKREEIKTPYMHQRPLLILGSRAIISDDRKN